MQRGMEHASFRTIANRAGRATGSPTAHGGPITLSRENRMIKQWHALDPSIFTVMALLLLLAGLAAVRRAVQPIQEIVAAAAAAGFAVLLVVLALALLFGSLIMSQR